MCKADGKEFIDFKKEYAIMNLEKNNIEVSKGYFHYDNIIMKNMRYKWYELMKEGLKIFSLKIYYYERRIIRWHILIKSL